MCRIPALDRAASGEQPDRGHLHRVGCADHQHVPFTARPPCTAVIASPLVAVARMTAAPPSLAAPPPDPAPDCRCISDAPSWRASASLSLPRRCPPCGSPFSPRTERRDDRARRGRARRRFARPRAAVAERVERREAGAHQRRCFDRRELSGIGATALAGRSCIPRIRRRT